MGAVWFRNTVTGAVHAAEEASTDAARFDRLDRFERVDEPTSVADDEVLDGTVDVVIERVGTGDVDFDLIERLIVNETAGRNRKTLIDQLRRMADNAGGDEGQ